jgi:isoleucyl-tRNA synthetase
MSDKGKGKSKPEKKVVAAAAAPKTPTDTAPAAATASEGKTGGSYDYKGVEDEVRELWKRERTYEKARAKATNPANPRRYFLDGPPYTSGHVHLGTAWNKSLKVRSCAFCYCFFENFPPSSHTLFCAQDMYIRQMRMRGYNVWDRAGYDMHGLPTERATEKVLGIFGKGERDRA